jgi:hypothetical protein
MKLYYSVTPSSLIIIVNSEIERLHKAFYSFSSDWDTVSVGQEVSTLLVAQNESEHAGAINRWIDERFRRSQSNSFVCYDIDLLFHPSLKLDPLAIFRQISRHKKLAVLWPGTYQRGILCYAQPEHNHYHCWRNLEGIDIKGADNALQ